MFYSWNDIGDGNYVIFEILKIKKKLLQTIKTQLK